MDRGAEFNDLYEAKIKIGARQTGKRIFKFLAQATKIVYELTAQWFMCKIIKKQLNSMIQRNNLGFVVSVLKCRSKTGECLP